MLNLFGWGAAFLMAGVGMFIGVIVFWIGMKHYRHADVIKPVQPGDAPLSKVFGYTILPALVAGVLGWLIPGNLIGSDSTDAFVFGSLPVAYFYFTLWKKAAPDEKRPISAMLTIFAVVIIFWAVFKQNGTALTTWANNYTDRELPASVVKTAGTLSLIDTIPLIDTIELKDHHFRKQRDDSGKVIMVIDTHNYFKNLPPERLPKAPEPNPDASTTAHIKAVNTNIFQSVNPGWVIVLTPLVVLFFAFMNRRGREPSTPSKIAWGLVISALSTLVMVGAVYAGDNGAVKVNPWWLIGAYGVITVGELCLSPMGLSLVSKLSPARLTALMMGGWFLATSLGNKLSGILATMWDGYENKAIFFLVNFALLGAAAIMLFAMLKRLNKTFRDYEGGPK
jgi:proton-dependent oligopeptide transporter, POT family